MSRSTAHVPHRPATTLTATTLTDDQLAVLRVMLEQQREFRVDQLTQLRAPARSGPLSSPQPEITRSLVAGARAALQDVQAALWRMEEGHYGRCVTCARPIEIERLEILPQSADCMICHRGAAG